VEFGVSESSCIAVLTDRDDWLVEGLPSWTRNRVQQVAAADFAAAVVGAIAAVWVSFGSSPTYRYLVLSSALPLLWVIAVHVSGGYEMRFLGTGSDEFREVLNAGVGLTGALAIISYAVNNELSRLYLLVSMPVIVMRDLLTRFVLRKRLHRLLRAGQCISTVVAVGNPAGAERLVNELRREPYHGLKVVAVSLAGGSATSEVSKVPVVGDLDAMLPRRPMSTPPGTLTWSPELLTRCFATLRVA
jgi:FlaA1/EpsC-like NDP-sugar epimerase